MSVALEDTGTNQARARRIDTVVLPNEGDDDLFTQTWYPICLSGELSAGQVRSFDFCDGKVVAYRGEDGTARVMSGFCPHLGADLGLARVIGSGLQCPWHRFEFDEAGYCLKTGTGDPAPRSARLFAFPTEEKFGVIWAFNGDVPLFEIPDFPADKSDLVMVTQSFPVDFGIEPWQLLGQIPDINHFHTLHRLKFLDPQPWDTVEWGPYSMTYEIKSTRDGLPFNVRQEIRGTNILQVCGELNGRWYGWLAPSALPAPGRNQLFSIFAVERLGDEAEALQFIDEMQEFNTTLAGEDIPITQTMRFRVGTLTNSDRVLHRFYNEYIRNYPRTIVAGGLLR